jgi:hypothetical protein
VAIKLMVNAAPETYSEQVAAAVIAALGRRPESEEWTIAILGGNAERGCIVSIDRPDGGSSRWEFSECGGEPIRDTIRQDLRREGYAWL